MKTPSSCSRRRIVPPGLPAFVASAPGCKRAEAELTRPDAEVLPVPPLPIVRDRTAAPELFVDTLARLAALPPPVDTDEHARVDFFGGSPRRDDLEK